MRRRIFSPASSSTAIVFCGRQTIEALRGSPNFASSAFCASLSAATEVIDLVFFRARRDVVRAGFDRRLEHRVLVGDLAVEDDQPDAVEHERDRARLGQRPARLGEIGAHFARGAVAVVGQRLDDHRHPARRVALVAHFVIVLGVRRRTPS